MKLPCITAVLITLISGSVLEARNLNLRALALAGESEIPERYVKVGDGYELLTFSSMQPGELLSAIAAESILPLYGLSENERGEGAFEMVEKIKIPTQARGILLLGLGNGEKTTYLAVNDDFANAKFNDWLFINAGSRKVLFQVGENSKPLALGPGGIVNHKLPTGEGKGMSAVGKAQWGEKVKTFYSTYWPVLGAERSIVIFFERGDRIGLRKITDTLLKKEAAAKPGEPSQAVRAGSPR